LVSRARFVNRVRSFTDGRGSQNSNSTNQFPSHENDKMQWSLTCIIVALALRIEHGVSMTASPLPFDEIQPDGSVVTLLLHGDEYSHESSDLQGEFRCSQWSSHC
jgi:hypothetical protein